MNPASPFGKASAFFGTAFNDMEAASDMQTRIQGAGVNDARFSADYDTSYMQGAVAPQTGPYGQDQGPADDVESVKRELLASARNKQRRPSNGSISFRAGGGTVEPFEE